MPDLDGEIDCAIRNPTARTRHPHHRYNGVPCGVVVTANDAWMPA